MDYKISQTIPIVQPLSPSMEPFMELQGTVAATSTAGDYFQRFGSTLMHSMQYVAPHNTPSSLPTVTVSAFMGADQTQNTDPSGLLNLKAWNDSNDIILHAASSSPTAAATVAAALPTFTTIANITAVNELQKQLEYDKFMNEIWIGIVLLLIFISMIFCVCSCLLYHQFRTWKRNYHHTLSHPSDADTEAFKVNPGDMDDPVPEYTLVSGLPSYEAALELLKCKSIINIINNNKTSEAISNNNNHNHNDNNASGYLMHVHPNIFEIFNGNNIDDITTTAAATATTAMNPSAVANLNNQEALVLQQQQQQQQQHADYADDEQQETNVVVTTPLLLTATTGIPSSTKDTNTIMLTTVNEKSKSNMTTTITAISKNSEKFQENSINNSNNNNNKNNNNNNNDKC